LPLSLVHHSGHISRGNSFGLSPVRAQLAILVVPRAESLCPSEITSAPPRLEPSDAQQALTPVFRCNCEGGATSRTACCTRPDLLDARGIKPRGIRGRAAPLSLPIRAGILAMVRSASGKEGK
jgi:hypothetical protein